MKLGAVELDLTKARWSSADAGGEPPFPLSRIAQPGDGEALRSLCWECSLAKLQWSKVVIANDDEPLYGGSTCTLVTKALENGICWLHMLQTFNPIVRLAPCWNSWWCPKHQGKVVSGTCRAQFDCQLQASEANDVSARLEKCATIVQWFKDKGHDEFNATLYKAPERTDLAYEDPSCGKHDGVDASDIDGID